jgi:hypothetical protein
MKLQIGEFGVIDWERVPAVEHAGEKGTAKWRTVQRGDVRIRMVEYSPGYVADHWCEKGHVILVLKGELHTDLKDGRRFTLTAGMSYAVSDSGESHRSTTVEGATLYVVD